MTRFYRALLHLYPKSFRIDFGDDMCAVFVERRSAAPGLLAGIGLLLEAVADIVPSALAVHWEVLRQDLRYTARTLSHARGFALTAVVVVALGVGANTAAFSVADFVLLRPLPLPHPDRLVKVWERTPQYARMELSPPNYRDWKAMNASFQSMAAINNTAVNLVGAGEPRRLTAAAVSPEFFAVLGVSPILGRVFAPADSATTDARTVVLSHDLWRSQFGGDAGVLGRAVDLSGTPYQVIGVMGSGFYYPSRETQLWIPLSISQEDGLDRSNNFLHAVARLNDGVTLDQARADLGVVAARLAREYPRANARTGATLLLLQDDVPRNARLLLLALCGASLCILLLACANLANLLLTRAAARERELAVRAALGAGRERLVRQMVTENVVLAFVGGTVGVLVAVLAVPLLARLVPTTLPIAEGPTVDLRVLTLAGLFTALTGLGFGLIPALRVGGRGGLDALREGARAGGRRQPLRAALVAIEVGLSVVLLVCSGLLLRAVWRVQATDPGFRADGVLTVRTALPRPKYDSTARRNQFYAQVLTGVKALPGVERAAFISFLPMEMTGGIWPVVMHGDEAVREAGNAASLRFVTPGFFATLAIPILRGRDVEQSDTFDRPFVAVVSNSFVQHYWPNEDPIGKRFRFAFNDRTVVGVVGDIRVRGLEGPSEPQVYLPHQQIPDIALNFYDPKDLVIRSSAPPADLLPAIRQIIRSADPEQPISHVQPLQNVVESQTASRRAQLRVLVALAVIALLLASVGIHGLLAFTVSQRRQEIGVRLALGAEPRGIVQLVVREGLLLAVLGVIPGIVGAYVAARGMSALLFGVDPGDPVTVAGAAGLSILMTLVGSLIPALRAGRVSPMAVMRAE